jgi:hypothetical protein
VNWSIDTGTIYDKSILVAPAATGEEDWCAASEEGKSGRFGDRWGAYRESGEDVGVGGSRGGATTSVPSTWIVPEKAVSRGRVRVAPPSTMTRPSPVMVGPRAEEKS